MKLRQALGVALATLLSCAANAESTVKLACAKSASGYADAEMQLRDQGANFVNVTFSRTPPTKNAVDWVLRDCLNTAIKLNAARDIVAFAWYRKHSSGALEPLEAYRGDVRLFYSASRHAVMLRKTLSSR
jgi:hypothetical protein